MSAGERSDWNRVRESSSRSELEAFRSRYPRSRHDAEAARLLGRLEWAVVDKTDSGAVRQFLLNHLEDPYFADEMRKDISRSGLTPADKPWRSFEGNPEEGDRFRSFVVEYRGADALRGPSELSARVLNRFVSAYESKSLDGLRMLWPSMPDREANEFRERFSAPSGIRMSFTVFEETASGTATDLIAEQAWFSQSGAQRRLVKIRMRNSSPDGIVEDIAALNSPAAASGSR